MRVLAVLLFVSPTIALAQDTTQEVCAANIEIAELMVEDAQQFKEKVAAFAMDIGTEGFGPQQIEAVGTIRGLRSVLMDAVETYRQEAEDLAYAMRICAR